MTEVPYINLETFKQGEIFEIFPDQPYSGILQCGEMEGIPMVTFTAVPVRNDYTKPTSAYLAMIARGLQEAHGISLEEAAAYLHPAPGVGDHFDSVTTLAEYIDQSI